LAIAGLVVELRSWFGASASLPNCLARITRISRIARILIAVIREIRVIRGILFMQLAMAGQAVGLRRRAHAEASPVNCSARIAIGAIPT
jgi:hypothetical protein